MLGVEGQVGLLLSFLISRPDCHSLLTPEFMHQCLKHRVKLLLDHIIELPNGLNEIFAAMVSKLFELRECLGDGESEVEETAGGVVLCKTV